VKHCFTSGASPSGDGQMLQAEQEWRSVEPFRLKSDIGRHQPQSANSAASNSTTTILGWASLYWAGHLSQLDPILPQCPIASRYNVIPAGYKSGSMLIGRPENLR
jgi:hypothetical protein